MKAKVARKHARHAMPARRRARAKKAVYKREPPAKKEVKQPEAVARAAEGPQMVEAVVATFEEPVEFVVTGPEPGLEVVEVFEVAEPEEFG